MYYVYILYFPLTRKHYTGLTASLKRRFKQHRLRESKVTKDQGICQLKFVAIFPERNSAVNFEKYLQSGSGRAFRNKHLV